MLYLWYNKPLTGVIYTRHESENQNWQKEGKEQKSSTERDWGKIGEPCACLVLPSSPLGNQPVVEKKRERKCGKVTLDGDVGGIWGRGTFWKVVGWSRWSPTSSCPPPLIILRAYWWQHENHANIWLKKRSGSERALNVTRSIRQTVPQRSIKQWWQWRRGGVTFSPWVFKLKTHANTEIYSLAARETHLQSSNKILFVSKITASKVSLQND